MLLSRLSNKMLHMHRDTFRSNCALPRANTVSRSAIVSQHKKNRLVWKRCWGNNFWKRNVLSSDQTDDSGCRDNVVGRHIPAVAVHSICETVGCRAWHLTTEAFCRPASRHLSAGMSVLYGTYSEHWSSVCILLASCLSRHDHAITAACGRLSIDGLLADLQASRIG